MRGDEHSFLFFSISLGPRSIESLLMHAIFVHQVLLTADEYSSWTIRVAGNYTKPK